MLFKKQDKFMKKIGIRNCEFAFKCSEDWESMKDVSGDYAAEVEVRFCGLCNKDVYLCDDDEDLVRHIKMNHCVAIQHHEIKMPITLGVPIPPRVKK